MTDWNEVRLKLIGKFVKVDECFMWLGSVSCGYGTMFLDGRNQRVHRLVYQLINGEIPAGCTNVDVLHKCNNKLCSNPAHLYLGTDTENNYDKFKIGFADGRKSFTDEEAEQVKRLRFGGKSLREISRIMKCDHHKVKRVLDRKVR